MTLCTMPPKDASKSPAGSRSPRGSIRVPENCAGGLKKASTKRRRSSVEADCGKTSRNWHPSRRAMAVMERAPAMASQTAMGVIPRQRLRMPNNLGLSDRWPWAAISGRPPRKLFASPLRKTCFFLAMHSVREIRSRMPRPCSGKFERRLGMEQYWVWQSPDTARTYSRTFSEPTAQSSRPLRTPALACTSSRTPIASATSEGWTSRS